MIWATLKLPQCSRLIELRASADGLRWAIGQAAAMAVIWVQIAKTANRAMGRTEPDVHLKKQVKQVTTSALEEPAWRRQDSERGVTNAVEILVFLIWQLPYWLQKRPKQPEEAGRPVCEGAVRQCCRP
jgi:hypothetical protein